MILTQDHLSKFKIKVNGRKSEKFVSGLYTCISYGEYPWSHGANPCALIFKMCLFDCVKISE